MTLLREGYDIETAGTVQDAVLHLSDRTYQLVITDMRLPDGTGLEILRWLEEAGRREKAIVITAYGSAENAVEALKAGAYDYLTKPVDLKQFRAVVASALGRAPSLVPTMVPASLPSAQGLAGGSSGGSSTGTTAGSPATPSRPMKSPAPRTCGRACATRQCRARAHGGPIGCHAAGALVGRQGRAQHGAGAGQR